MAKRHVGHLDRLVTSLTRSRSISVPVMCEPCLFFRKPALYSNDDSALGLLSVYLPHYSTGGRVAPTQKIRSVAPLLPTAGIRKVRVCVVISIGVNFVPNLIEIRPTILDFKHTDGRSTDNIFIYYA